MIIKIIKTYDKMIKKIFNKPYIIAEFLKDRYNLLPYYYKKTGFAHSPTTIFIAINSVCNLKCEMCDFGQQNENSLFYKNLKAGGGELSFDTIKKLIDDVKKSKPKIAITSAEPLLYKNIVKTIKYIKKSGLSCQLTTNGYYLEKFANDLVKSKVNEIWISLDGPSKIHNEIRGVKNSYEKAIAGIKKIQKIKGNTKSPTIHINYTITDKNFDLLNGFYSDMKKLNISQITFSHLNFVTDEISKIHNKTFGKIGMTTPTSLAIVNPKKININQLYKNIQEIKNVNDPIVSFLPEMNKKQIDDYYNIPKKFVTRTKCYVPWLSAQILANGDVTMITRCFNIKFGNINEEKLSKIWNNKKYKNFRKIMKEKGVLPACSRCCGIF